MNKVNILQLISKEQIIAIIRSTRQDDILPLIQAVSEGGIRVMEIALNTPGALKLIRESSQVFSSKRIILGAGTVLKPQMAEEAIRSGAQFIITPILNPEVIKLCKRHSIPVISGAFTPTEIMAAWNRESDLIKVFPAHTLGPEYIRSVLASLPRLSLVPVGGIDEHNILQYLDAGAMAVGVGVIGRLVSGETVESKDWKSVTLASKRLKRRIKTRVP